MTRIIIENEQDEIQINDEIENTIKRVIEASLEYENCDFDAEVSVTIVDNEAIREINKETRNLNMPTDVLSFPMLYFDKDGNIIDSDYDMDGEVYILGDIVISAERAKMQAEEFGHSIMREYAFLIAHSMLHLLGYDHMEEEERMVMEEKQRNVLDHLGISR